MTTGPPEAGWLPSPVAFLACQLKRSAPGGSSFPQLRRFNSKVN